MANKKKKSTNHWIILVILALAQFMVVLDVSIVNVMLPSVQHAFHLTESNLQWIITAYSLTFGGFLLLGGRAADLYGRRRVFLAGVIVFTIASLLDGLSQSGGMLISLRAVQGLAGAFMSPAALSIVLVTYREGHERNLALSVWGAVAAGGAAVGVLLGGIITQYFGWRWNFFINVPVGVFVFIMASRLVAKHEAEERDSSLDLPGAVTITGGLMMLVYALVKAPASGWTSKTSLVYFAISLALIIAFIINESRVKHPLIPLSIFKIRNLSGADLIQFSTAAGLFSVFFFCTLYFQEVLGYTAVRTGVAFLPIPITIAIVATNVPKIIQKVGYRKVLIVAPLISATGLFMLGHIPVNGGYWTHILPGLLVMAVGLGSTFVSVLIAATSGIPGHLSGLASGLVNTAQQVGGALGIAVLTGIATSSTVRYLSHQAHPQTAVAAATVHGFHVGFFVACGFSIVASLLAIFVVKQTHVKAPAEAAVDL
ncbi:MAG TPA: MFS transporter [Candidatus Saccharimonadales bacterium]